MLAVFSLENISFDPIQFTLKSALKSLKWSRKTLIKGSLEEILPSYEKLRSVCAHVRDAKRSRLTVGRVGTLGAAHVRRMCGGGPRRDWGIAFHWFFGVRSSIGKCNRKALEALAGEFRGCVKESNVRYIIGECNCKALDALAGEFRGCVRQSDAQGIIGECNCKALEALAGEFRGFGQESDAQRIIGECNCRVLDALAGEFRGRIKRK